MFKNKIINNKLYRFGYINFLIGLFLVPTALPIAIIFLLIAALISSFFLSENFFKDNWNILFAFSGLIILTSTLIHSLNINNDDLPFKLELISIWGGIFNWIPLFWIFWAFKVYQCTPEKRKLVSLVLISGTIPVLITFFVQYFLNWTGPFETLNGLIVWYQKPILFEKGGGVTGLFSNANYAGSWLNIILPFSIAALYEKKANLIKTFNGFLAFTISSFILLTNSKLAWLSFVLILLFMGGIKLSFVLIILFFFFLLFANLSQPILDLVKKYLPERVWMEFTVHGYKSLEEVIPFSRLNIWKSGIEIVNANPIFGSGIGSFPIIYEAQTNFFVSHAHNLFLEISINFGLFAGIALTSTILALLIKGIKFGFFDSFRKEKVTAFDKAWIVSSSIFFFSQMFDIQYYDGKISMMSWILLSGLNSMLDTNFRNNYE